jgi:hypothetical protein
LTQAVAACQKSAVVPINPLRSYGARYLGLSFPELVERLASLEEDIVSDAVSDVTDAISEHATEIRGDVIRFGDYPVRLSVSSHPESRVLAIILVPLTASVKPRRFSADIEEFGFVRTIEVDVPPRLAHIGEGLVDRLSGLVRAAYIALESAYVARYRDWRARIHNTSYELVNIELRVAGNEECVGRYWFSLTNLKSETFHYAFGDEGLRKAITWLKEHQTSIISPCSAATLLIIEEVVDAVFALPDAPDVVRLSADETILEFAELPTLGESTDFWIAEHALYGSRSIVALDVARVGDVVLQANCPPDIREMLKAAIVGVQDDLSTLFTRQYGEYVADQKRLTRALRKARESKPQWLRELGTDVVAKTLAEMMKTH